MTPDPTPAAVAGTTPPSARTEAIATPRTDAPAPPAGAAAAARPARHRFGPVGSTLSMIKFQHTLFALPFAFTGAILAAGGLPRARVLGWILGAMVGARSAAMVWNRIADLEIDRRNPRTATRPLVTGELGMTFAWGFLLASLALFYLSAAMLNPLALLLATPAAAVILSYSWAKRVTWLTHLHLGLSLGIAPVGAWVAVTGRIGAPALALGAAVTFWVAGFDVIYSCQDVDFDRREGLHSMPARFGIAAALWLARVFHVLTVLLLASVGRLLPLDGAWMAAVALTAGLLTWEHTLVRPDDLRRANQAFFVVLAGAALALALRG
jgi:4-hydroxybenzoate polyprenyltransferase